MLYKNFHHALHIHHSVDVIINITEIKDLEVQLSINCTEVQASRIQQFVVRVTSYDLISISHSQNISLPCPSDIIFTGLTPNTTFEISVVWFINQPHMHPVECVVETFMTTIG